MAKEERLKAYDLLNITYDPSALKIVTSDALKAITDKKEVLQVKAAATHAARVTGNGGLYLPSMMSRSIPRWTTPFQRPVLVSHDRSGDPIGRTMGARFIKTPPTNISDDVLKAAYGMRRLDNKDAWWWIDKMYKDMLNPNFEGLGYTELTYYVSDPRAVQKILDGRYLTLSISYGSDDLYCSICKVPIHSGDCDHWIGDFDDETGKPVIGVYGNLYPREVSYVNVPADDYARHTEYEFVATDCEGNSVCNMAATSAFTQHFSQMIEDAEVVLIRDDSTKNFYMNNNTGGNDMALTMKQLLKDTKSNYEELAKHLPEGVKPLSEDELKKLDNASFAGPNRTFPVVDAAHVAAIEKLLEEVKDSAAKREFIATFNEIKDELQKQADTEDAKRALLDAETYDNLTTDELKTVYQNALEAAKARGVVKEPEDSEDDTETALQVVKARNEQLKTSLQVAQDSLKQMVQDMVEQYTYMIVDLKKFAGMEIKDEKAYADELKQRSLTSLKDLYKDIRDSVSDKLDGTSQEDDPSVKHKHDATDDEDTEAQRKAITEHYNFLLKNVGIDAAQDYLNLKIAEGKLKKDDKKE